MNRHRVNTIILCEDLQHEVFVYRFLKQTGRANVRNVKPRRSPAGRGSGAKYVLEHFSEEVRAYRKKSSYGTRCLVVAIDADNCSVKERIRQLEESLTASGQEKRGADERIVILVPKRNIETWIYYLAGQEVDETISYRELDKQSDCMPAVRQLVAWYPDHIPPEAPDSLTRACAEGRRCSGQPNSVGCQRVARL